MFTHSSLRAAYLDFFKQKGHAIVPSSPIVPENDPTTLFTGSGMQPMVPFLLGEKHPLGTRIADSQRCFRSQDIEEVGDNRHTTFFEMLGNWSLGDYFKKEQLTWLFEFLTTVVGLDPHRLFVTVFAGQPQIKIEADNQAVTIWQQLFASQNITATTASDAASKGMQDARIFFYDETKNWWSRAGEPAKMPALEPGGPDSEVFYDFGAELKLHEHSAYAQQPCHVNCDCGRFLEIGNSVFMQYQKQTDGSFQPLPQKNVDFGGGLERLLAATHNDPDIFHTSFFAPLIGKIEALSGKKYGQDLETTRSMRIIADHVRAAVMLAADGVLPANKEQGYFARRLLRRSLRYGDMLGLSTKWLPQLVAPVVEVYADVYPLVAESQANIETSFSLETDKFQSALKKGLHYLASQPTINEKTAFYVYETHGFPFELTAEIAGEKGQTLSEEKFQQERELHAAASRAASAGKFKGGLQDQSEATIAFHTTTHLLHAALRQVLGKHVQQKGSNITAQRLRFDFSHPNPLTQEQKDAVIDQVNAWIEADLPVTRQEMSKTQALESGALAFFGQKYPDTVSVYTIGLDPQKNWISKELCGGPHVAHTGMIGKVQLVKEQSVSANVRRIYLQFAQ